MASELLKRSEVKEADTWNVKDMYPTTEAWENELKVITEIVDKIALYEGSVAATAENLLAVLEHLASAGEKIEKAFNYAERLFDEDQTNTTHQAMSAKVYSLYAAMGSKTAFADPEIIAASDETLEAFYKELPALELYQKADRRNPQNERTLSLSRDGKTACNDSRDEPDTGRYVFHFKQCRPRIPGD